jgi:hypothetical protein
LWQPLHVASVTSSRATTAPPSGRAENIALEITWPPALLRTASAPTVWGSVGSSPVSGTANVYAGALGNVDHVERAGGLGGRLGRRRARAGHLRRRVGGVLAGRAVVSDGELGEHEAHRDGAAGEPTADVERCASSVGHHEADLGSVAGEREPGDLDGDAGLGEPRPGAGLARCAASPAAPESVISSDVTVNAWNFVRSCTPLALRTCDNPGACDTGVRLALHSQVFVIGFDSSTKMAHLSSPSGWARADDVDGEVYLSINDGPCN